MIPMTRWYERLRTRTAAMVHDALMVPLAWLFAYWVRFNLESIPPPFFEAALQTIPLVLAVCSGFYWWFGLYRGVWHFASLPDLLRILKAVTAATATVFLLLFFVNRLADMPRSVPLLFWGLQLALLAGPRLFYRWLKDRRLTLNSAQRVLIVGAGRAGEMLVRDMLRDPARTYQPIAFVDDRPHRQGSAIHEVPIRGTAEHIPALVSHLGIDLILLAIPSATARQMQRLVEYCEQAACPFRTVPPLDSLMSGQVRIDQLRAVSIEDLLGRQPVALDWDSLRAGLVGRRILVTGAGGSIGAELCRQLLHAGVERLILVDHSELNLYQLEMEITKREGGFRHVRALIDVTDQIAVDALFARERPQVVFHAAAYKHVPMLENQLRVAVRNNVAGTRIVAEAAADHQCERFVLISTDKAVNPANVMGATKRVAEIICQQFATDSSTRFVTVRFGNVLGSTGSVVPLFQHQIAQGGPVTVTDPEVERFFMTIPEACQLIMQAAVLGNGGEIFVLDMGEPVKIGFLAEQMIRLFGFEPGREIAIEIIGLRPGEKRFEELFYTNETTVTTQHPKIRMAQSVAPAQVGNQLALLEQALAAQDEAKMRCCLQALVPNWDQAPQDCTEQACINS